MNKQRWRFTKGKQYECTECGRMIDKRYIRSFEKEEPYIYCSSTCHMWDIGMDFSDFY